MITRTEFRKAAVAALNAYDNDEDDTSIVIGNRAYGEANHNGLSLGRGWVRYRGYLLRNMTGRAYSEAVMYPLRREWVNALRAERAKGKVYLP